MAPSGYGEAVRRRLNDQLQKEFLNQLQTIKNYAELNSNCVPDAPAASGSKGSPGKDG